MTAKKKEYLCLGIESTAHTFGCSIVKNDGTILSNIKDAVTTDKGGLIPVEVAEHHARVCDTIIKKTLTEARCTLQDIKLISYSRSPGIGHMLRIGGMVARSLAQINKIPLVGVNHCIAHLEIGKLTTKAKDPVFLYASGANTQVIAFEGKKYRVFGETLDTGVGNFLDTFARDLQLGFPGGPKVYELALQGKKLIPLPYCVKGMDTAFSGILTSLKQKRESKMYSKEDLCFSAQETVFAMLLEVCERAMAHCDKKELLLGGGVAANKRLQEMADIMCQKRGATCFKTPQVYCTDNAAMIAWLGILEYNAGISTTISNANVDPYERVDDFIVTW